MQKYKLVKKYPHSPELDTIVVKGSSVDPYPNMYGDILNKHFFNTNEIENYPEFWEKIVEKDYEILSYKCFSKDLKRQQLFIKQNNLFCWSTVQHNESYILNNMWNNKTGGYVINSVKRLSDNVVFTISDNTNAGIIKQFNICGNTLQLKVDGLIFLNNYLVKKAKPILFVTEDGVDIFEGDKVTPVNLDTLESHATTSVKTGESLKYGNYKHFSTHEKAKEYILMNKPCVSVNEIIPLINYFDTSTYSGLNKLTEKLKELVKSKL